MIIYRDGWDGNRATGDVHLMVRNPGPSIALPPDPAALREAAQQLEQVAAYIEREGS